MLLILALSAVVAVVAFGGAAATCGAREHVVTYVKHARSEVVEASEVLPTAAKG